MIGNHKLLENHSLSQIIILALVIFSLLTIIYWALPFEITPKMSTYMQMFSLLIFLINCFVTVKSFKNQNEDRAKNLGIQYANLTQNKISDIDKLFMSSPLLDRLYYQMYQDNPHIVNIMQLNGPINETPEILKAEHHAASLIIQRMADIYACEKLDDLNNDTIEWINTFKGWLKSPILRSHWKYLKHEQHPNFIHFVDNILIRNQIPHTFQMQGYQY